MSAFTDFFHSIVSKLPFFDEAAQTAAHSAVEEVEQELLTKVEDFVNTKLGVKPGVVTAQDVSGVAANTASTDQNQG